MPDLSGELIDGRYQLQALIAEGGMASIYRALDTRLDRPVAVKIMHSHLANDEDFVNRFIREAKATASLNHPNVVAIQDQGWNTGGVPAVFIVMEYVDGFTLRDLMAERGAMPAADALRLVTPILNALSAAHRIGIIHRDIKPENILISKDGRVKIADFGLARAANLGQTMTMEASVILGSVSYLSPEQVQRGISDSRSDVYSLGILLFEMLTGQKPYEGETAIQIAYRHVNDKVPKPSSIKSDIPDALDTLIVSMTSVDPDARPREASDVLNVVRTIQESIDPKRRQLTLELDIPPLPAVAKPGKAVKATTMIASLPTEAPKPEPVVEREIPVTTESQSLIIKRNRKEHIRRNRVIALLFLVVAVTGAFAWYEIAGPGSKIAIPSVVGLSTSDATSALTPLGLHAVVAQQVFSENVAVGRVISSFPGGGGHLASGGTVSLTVSKGKERLTVPSLKGLTPDVASNQIASAGLKVGTITEIFSSKVAKGHVIAIAPGPGSKVRRDSLVNLVVSKGREQIAASSYVGQSGDQALNELTNLGFQVTSTYAFSDTIPVGAVMKQAPAGGVALNKGAKISLIISQGPEAVFIPNIYSLTAGNATRVLENLQLQVVVKKIGTKKVKTVTNVFPNVGVKVKRGSTVVITVG